LGGEVAALEDLEARVAALEASQADYRAVLAAVNASGASQQEHSLRLDQLRTEVADVPRGRRPIPIGRCPIPLRR
jgi:hypothetical protein